MYEYIEGPFLVQTDSELMVSTCGLSPRRVFSKAKLWALVTFLEEGFRSDLRKVHGETEGNRFPGATFTGPK